MIYLNLKKISFTLIINININDRFANLNIINKIIIIIIIINEYFIKKF